MRNSRYLWSVAAVFLLIQTVESYAAIPSAEELSQAQAWASARFKGELLDTGRDIGLTVLANNDPVQKRGRNGRAMNIAGQTYTRGLYCHAMSHVEVKLPASAAMLEAEIGIDTNQDTSGGRGSVFFVVKSGSEELFRSELIREGMPPRQIKVDLKGAKFFSLIVEDAGDGIACDQSDWADLRVKMSDGSLLWVDELPILNQETVPIEIGPFFSFTFNGENSKDLLPNWNLIRRHGNPEEGKIKHELIWQQPQGGLQVRCEAVEYCDYPTVEWTLYFKNTGEEKTPILENINALDAEFPIRGGLDPILHHQIGTPSTQSDYKPMTSSIAQGNHLQFTPAGGRGTDGNYPYYNLEYPGDGGVIMVVGWPGQWKAEFSRQTSEKKIRMIAGQELTHLSLLPGEEIRTPLMVLQFWAGEYIDSQNVWRSWMLDYNVPQTDGKPAPLHWAACSSHQYAEMIKADSASQKHCIDRYLAEKIGLEYWWMDAGWYVNDGTWVNTGTWEVDQNRFPGGLKPITDHGHSKGVKSLVWFEPERVTPGTWLYTEHPEWLLPLEGKDTEWRLLNMGNPEAWNWLVNHIDGLIKSEGIDLYRQDFNIAPLPYWRKADAPDRQGITENKYVCGYLAYWDELLKRHPGMLIDSCASGGRRNDLETLRRSVPLLRSDYIFEPIGQQGHSYGMSLWVPLFGTGVMGEDLYTFLSCMTPYVNSCWDIRSADVDHSAKLRNYQIWAEVKDYFYGDYYPLTRYQLEPDLWMAWQYHRPDKEEGMVLAFARQDTPYPSLRVRLMALDENAIYRITSPLNAELDLQLQGGELLRKGFVFTSQNMPEAHLIVYKKVQ